MSTLNQEQLELLKEAAGSIPVPAFLKGILDKGKIMGRQAWSSVSGGTKNLVNNSKVNAENMMTTIKTNPGVAIYPGAAGTVAGGVGGYILGKNAAMKDLPGKAKALLTKGYQSAKGTATKGYEGAKSTAAKGYRGAKAGVGKGVDYAKGQGEAIAANKGLAALAAAFGLAGGAGAGYFAGKSQK